VEGRRGSGEGSGMVLSQDGLLLTNNHVVEAAANGGTVTAVFQDGATAPAQIVGRDPSFDLAVLRAGNVSGLTPIELGNSDAVRVGQQVIAFGSPLGLGGTVTTGIISAINRPVSVGGNRAASEATVLNALQTDAAINPGNSGGPLVDMEGKLIGINSAIATTGAEGGSIGVGFSIPVNQAKRVAEELERTGKATRAQLGVGVGDEPNVSGARIRSVEPGSPAEKAGIKAGDLVLRFGGQRILSGEGLQAAVRSRTPGETVEVELSDRKLSATLGVAS
jgi:putative serine protease PepD